MITLDWSLHLPVFLGWFFLGLMAILCFAASLLRRLNLPLRLFPPASKLLSFDADILPSHCDASLLICHKYTDQEGKPMCIYSIKDQHQNHYLTYQSVFRISTLRLRGLPALHSAFKFASSQSSVKLCALVSSLLNSEVPSLEYFLLFSLYTSFQSVNSFFLCSS